MLGYACKRHAHARLRALPLNSSVRPPQVRMKWLRVSVIAQAILALYFQTVQWFPIGKWNYQPASSSSSPFSNIPLIVLFFNGQLTLQAVLLVTGVVFPVILFSLGYIRHLRWLMWLQIPAYSIWIAVEMSWWVFYAAGRTDPQIETYKRVFAPSTQLLPSFGRHFPPDGAHIVLHILLAIVLLSALMGLLRTSPETKGIDAFIQK